MPGQALNLNGCEPGLEERVGEWGGWVVLGVLQVGGGGAEAGAGGDTGTNI
jgi:hypothetical protein